MTNHQQYANDLARNARDASFELSQLSTSLKNQWLKSAAEKLEKAAETIVAENRKDLENGKHLGLGKAQLDRLELTPKRLFAMTNSMREIAFMEDPVGRVLHGGLRPNGLQINKVGVPLGVIFFIFESRPNVTTDAAALSLKSGNAIILRGGKEAIQTNYLVVEILRQELRACGITENAIQLVSRTDREVVGHLLKNGELIDLAIPRGGEELIRRVSQEATMPVMKHYHGNCHVYVEESACRKMALEIILNSKCQRPGVCNAAESILVDKKIASTFIPELSAALSKGNVEIRGCGTSLAILPSLLAATEEDFRTEYLDLIVSLKVVDDIHHAIRHINHYGSKHTDVIVTQNLEKACQFTKQVDSSAVVVNASSRFNDGGQIGLGAEIGISTDKFHARGPCGLNELTSYKYVIMGNGQIRPE